MSGLDVYMPFDLVRSKIMTVSGSTGGDDRDQAVRGGPINLMSKGNELEFQKGAGTKPECDGNYGGKNRDHTCHGTALMQKFIDFRGLLEF
jgi:hypothetical protein